MRERSGYMGAEIFLHYAKLQKNFKHMKKFKKFLIDSFVLIMPVMLGVYLGLLANNWNEARKTRKQTAIAQLSLIREIEHNQEVVSQSIKYFKQLRDSTVFHLQSGVIRNPSSFSFWQGLNPPLLRNAAFQSITLSGIASNFDLELLEQLNSTYNLQEDLKEQSQTYVSSVTTKIGTTDFDDYRYLIILQNYAYDQLVTEQAFLQELAKTQQLLQSETDK